MTVGHLVFATLSTAYILVGVRFEERNLAEDLPGYAEYAARTPRFFPRFRRSKPVLVRASR
jgi:protein-S-isoprenylcysteine O-methyltransferase Ste14